MYQLVTWRTRWSSPEYRPCLRMTFASRTIRNRLLGIIAATVIAIVVVHDLVAVREVRRMALSAATERLQSVSNQLGDMLQGQARQMRRLVAANARRPAVRALLDQPALAARRDSVAELLRRDISANLVGVSVWGPANEILVSVGVSPEPDSAIARELIMRSNGGDSTAIGRLYRVRDTLVYGNIARVTDGARVLGSVVEWRRFARSPEGRRQLFDLIGSDAAIYIGNTDGDGWTDFADLVARPALSLSAADTVPRLTTYERPGAGEQLAGVRSIPGTPWTFVVEFPRANVLRPVRAMLTRLALSAVPLLLIGVALAWWFGARLTKPLHDLTEAARGISGGDYARRVVADGPDDVRTVATAFNQMADSVATAHEALAERADELANRAQQLEDQAVELETANEQLAKSVDELTRTRDELGSVSAQLLQSQKMEAVGRLAGGVAHDFNNILTAISGFGQFVLADLGATNGGTKADIEQVLAAAERGGALTRQLLAFSRQQVLQPRVLDLNAVVTALGPMLARLIGTDIQLRTVAAPQLSAVKADPNQMEQVLVNLVVNARDAMPHGGTITIETADVELDESYASTHDSVTPGHYVVLVVTDNGSGMDAATRARVFDPFFTTKGPSKGTGLGLSTVYGIVKQSGGNIEVYSEPGQGTSFKVYLPRCLERLDAEAATRAVGSPNGKAKILLVDDDPHVSAAARRALERAGYMVLTASNGVEGLRVATDQNGALDLLITDLVMPEMGGRELARRVVAEQAGIRVLFTSGYTAQAMNQQAILQPGDAFLGKPFTPDALLRRVDEVMRAVTT
jgi:signal transduction histidine kinase/ActR/RegA family two-component response regulator